MIKRLVYIYYFYSFEVSGLGLKYFWLKMEGPRNQLWDIFHTGVEFNRRSGAMEKHPVQCEKGIREGPQGIEERVQKTFLPHCHLLFQVSWLLYLVLAILVRRKWISFWNALLFEEKQTHTITKHPTFLSRNRGQKYRAYKDERRNKNLKQDVKLQNFYNRGKHLIVFTQKIKPIAIYLPVDNQLETEFQITTSLQNKQV